MQRSSLLLCALLATGAHLDARDLVYKDRVMAELVEQVPRILRSFDAATGRFGEGIWICTDQNLLYPLAVAYAQNATGNKYYKDSGLLDVIGKAGDALIEDADETGQWVFRKKDGSTWGTIWMPWTYSRWARSFLLIRDDMPAERREAWERALRLGYTGISQSQLGHVHNIPAHHAMGLYVAGRALNEPEWCRQAEAFLRKVADAQSEGGYWTEGGGPVVAYNFVYVDALGTYYALSRDPRVLPALEKVARFHDRFTYPGGQNVETVDQRNPYHDRVAPGNVGFTFSPDGRSYLARQWAKLGMEHLGADLIASLLLYGEEGPISEAPTEAREPLFVLREGGVDRAATIHQAPWFVCLSAYSVPISRSRWIQDRQSFLSIYHERIGLIAGGGNTKLQPAWSSFTVGDTSLLRHEAGDESPDFLPRGDLLHVPSEATLLREPLPGLDLTYGPETCRIRVGIRDSRRIEIVLESTVASGRPVAAHLTLIPFLGTPLRTEAGTSHVLDATPIELASEQVGGGVSHAGYRLRLPASASLHWPALPHNPYRRDGRSTATEGRIEIRIPFTETERRYELLLEALDPTEEDP